MNNIKVEIKWALIFSVMVLLWMWLEKLSGLHEEFIGYHLYLTNLFAIPAFIIMALALKDKKKSFYNGQMTYKQGLFSGAILSVFIAALSPLTQWMITYVISPEYFPNVIKHAVELGYSSTTAEAEAYFNFPNYVKQGAIGALIMGVVTSAILMIFIRTRNK